MLRLGVHVSIAGKIYEAVDRANALKINTMQIFSRSPREWRRGSIAKEDIEEFRKRVKQSRIRPVFVHIPYLANLASPFNKLFYESIKTYIADIREAEALGAQYLVTHMGSHKKSGERRGLKRLIRGINRILESTEDTGVTILLENTSGSGSWLGYKFIHQAEVISSVAQKSRVGLCVDTCHAYSAGYDIAAEEGLEMMLSEIDSLIGLRKIKLIHLNDTKDKLGSHHDRHAHIGKGRIGLEGFARIVNHLKLRDVPFILETPKRKEGEDRRNVEAVRRLVSP